MEKHHSSERDSLVQLSQKAHESKELSDEQRHAKLFELSVSLANTYLNVDIQCSFRLKCVGIV